MQNPEFRHLTQDADTGESRNIAHTLNGRVKSQGRGAEEISWRMSAYSNGEFNGLGAGISVGRKIAGFWFHSGHLDGSGMCKVIAIGMLEEQALSYPNDDLVSYLPKFDCGMVSIGD